jgi:hypothetical protein
MTATTLADGMGYATANPSYPCYLSAIALQERSLAVGRVEVRNPTFA